MTIGSSVMQVGTRIKGTLPDEISPLLPIDRPDSFNEKFNGPSFSGAVFNLSTTIIGAGIMSLPATLKVLGLVLGVLMIVLMAFLTEQSIQFLLMFSRAESASSYGGLMGNAFGNFGRFLLHITIIVNNFGYLVVYMIIIGDVFSGTSSSSGAHYSGILEQWFGASWWTSRTFVLLFITLAIFLPLTCFKRIDSLRYTSALSVGLAVAFLAITIVITVVKLVSRSIMMPRILPAVSDLSSVVHLFTSFPILVTAYLCHYNVHSIQNELAQPTQMRNVARASLTLCSSVYITTSVFGYLLFGEETLDDFLANFNSDLGIPFSSVLSGAVRLSYAGHLMLVFPILFYPLRWNIGELLCPSAPLDESNVKFAAVTVGLVSMVYIGGCFVPSIWDAFQFTGATAAVCLGFIFPAAIALRDADGITSMKDKILSALMIALAVFSNIMAVYSDVSALIHK